MQKKTGWGLAALAMASLLAIGWLAPQDPDEARWEDYLDRIARLSRQALPERAPLPLLPYPGARELRLPLPEHRVDMLDYLELRHCGLMELISQRNSSLGKLQADSLRLSHELAFIQQARTCLEENTLDDPELVTVMSQVVAEKEAALPALYWNVLANSEEIRRFFSQSPSASVGDTSAALQSLQQLSHTVIAHKQSGAVTPLNLEPLLETLAHNQSGGYLLRRMALSLRELERGNQLLAGIDPQRLCPRNQASTRARRLRNVLDKVWGPKVQQALAQSRRQRQSLADSLEQMNGLLGSAPAPFTRWRQHYFGPNGVESRMEHALERHVTLWQEHLRACGLMPEKP
ncbi:DUF3080 family protein [uncultured Alcanivorax sp.]|uniref:DUF3080 family protein n=1 Tax=Alcanivorax sp. IL2 TaxID=3396310 RepID=UPI0026130C94|nr:DUF3080 family protein [uncultured Alcanivorax sp.]